MSIKEYQTIEKSVIKRQKQKEKWNFEETELLSDNEHNMVIWLKNSKTLYLSLMMGVKNKELEEMLQKEISAY